MARDSEDTADNSAPSTETKPKSEPRARNGGKTTPPPDAPKAEAKKPEPAPEPKKPEAEPEKEPEKPKAEPEKEKPKAEEPKDPPPVRTAQDACAEALEAQLKKAQRDKDSCWDNLAALDRLSLNLAVMLSTLTSDTKNRYSGLVTEAEELMTAMKTRSDRIRIFTETIPGRHGLNVGDLNNEEMLADALECPVKAAAFRDELAAHVPDARDKNTLDSFVLRANGAVAILVKRKRDEAKAHADARDAQAEADARLQDQLREEAERQARANAPNPFANVSADEAARKRQEDWLRGQQATAAVPDPNPAPAAATATQLAVKATTVELLELVQAYPVRSGALLLAFMIAVYLYFT